MMIFLVIYFFEILGLGFLVFAVYHLGHDKGQEQLKKRVWGYLNNCTLSAHEKAKGMLRPKAR